METSVTVISDTHWRHDEIKLPAGDLLIHCGDMFNLFGGAEQQIASIDKWFGQQKFKRIIYTGGNHDRELETELLKRPQPLKNAHFLNDAAIEFQGLTIYGAAWVPNLPRHAFFKRRADIAEAWAKVPSKVDILVTHTPPLGILDQSSSGQSLGCQSLAGELERISPRVHCFGHVHAGAGQRRVGETLFINASSIESGTGFVRPAVRFTLTSGVR